MKILPISESFIMPTKGTDKAGAFDIYMPTAGIAMDLPITYHLGFATEIPPGYAALLLPRSGVGSRVGLELNNSVGLIDSDYRDEWMATVRTKDGLTYAWSAGERVLQFMVVPIANITLQLVDSLEVTTREGGYGSTGK